MNQNEKRGVTIEQLMRLKRVELPAPEFWSQFDKDLRAKQLTAILDKRPWWRSFPRVYGFAVRHPMALGTAAALSIAFFSVSEYRGNNRAPISSSGDEVAFSAVESAAPVHAGAPAALPVSAPLMERPAALPIRMTVTKKSEESFSQELAAMMAAQRTSPLLTSIASRDDMLQVERDERIEAPVGRTLGPINLAAIQMDQPQFVRTQLGFSQNFQPASSADRGQIAEPLAQMASPSEERRSRLMAEGLPVMASLESAPAPANDSVVNRLSDDRVYESISRYDLDANRLSIKF